MTNNRYSVVLTAEDIDLLTAGLHVRACFIETDTPHLRAGDAANAGQQEKIKPLSVDQMRVLVAMDDLDKRLNNLKNGSGAEW